MDETKSPPRSVWVLGTAALLPFFVASGLFCYGPREHAGQALQALLGYSTAILSFYGGIRAGLEIDRPEPRWIILALSLGVPLSAFGLLFSWTPLGPDWQIGGFIAAFLALWLWDVTDHDGPAWRPRFRTLITTGAVVSQAFALEQALHL